MLAAHVQATHMTGQAQHFARLCQRVQVRVYFKAFTAQHPRDHCYVRVTDQEAIDCSQSEFFA